MFLHKFIGSVILSLSSPCRWLHEKYTTVSSMGPSSQLWRWSLFAYRISCPRFKLYNSHHQTEYKSSTVLQSRLIHVLQKHIEHLERHLLSQIFHDLRHICSPQGYLNHVSHWSDKFRSTAHIVATRFTNTYIYIYKLHCAFSAGLKKEMVIDGKIVIWKLNQTNSDPLHTL